MMKTLPSLVALVGLSFGTLQAHPHPDAPLTQLEHLLRAADHLEEGGAKRQAESLRRHVTAMMEDEEKDQRQAEKPAPDKEKLAKKPTAASKPVQVRTGEAKPAKKAIAKAPASKPPKRSEESAQKTAQTGAAVGAAVGAMLSEKKTSQTKEQPLAARQKTESKPKADKTDQKAKKPKVKSQPAPKKAPKEAKKPSQDQSEEKQKPAEPKPKKAQKKDEKAKAKNDAPKATPTKAKGTANEKKSNEKTAGMAESVKSTKAAVAPCCLDGAASSRFAALGGAKTAASEANPPQEKESPDSCTCESCSEMTTETCCVKEGSKCADGECSCKTTKAKSVTDCEECEEVMERLEKIEATLEQLLEQKS
ncbi:MAG: hypothetical protein Q7Q71_00940 [Verrucomicrobiota bacterium JB023]|nr:hypothetical protein [Verrucomicrobiota bacterium JB023]